MADESYAVLVQSNAIDALGLDGKNIARNIARAVNATAKRARPAAARAMREQVAFPARYLSSQGGRLQQTKIATEADPMAVITGRHRPTSLARFASNARQAGQRGARVEVSPGAARFLPGAFFIRLPAGRTDGSNTNLGLAIRLPAGQRPSRAYKPTLLGRGLWLLYGPSVDQVFDDVAAELAPESAAFLEREFLRLTDIGLQ